MWLHDDELFPVIKAAQDHIGSDSGNVQGWQNVAAWSRIGAHVNTAEHVTADPPALRCQTQQADSEAGVGLIGANRGGENPA